MVISRQYPAAPFQQRRGKLSATAICTFTARGRRAFLKNFRHLQVNPTLVFVGRSFCLRAFFGRTRRIESLAGSPEHESPLGYFYL